MPSRLEDTIQVTESTCAGIGDYLRTLGVTDEGFAYRQRAIGQWLTEDFGDATEITKQWEITDEIDGIGAYRVQFVYLPVRVVRPGHPSCPDALGTPGCSGQHHRPGR